MFCPTFGFLPDHAIALIDYGRENQSKGDTLARESLQLRKKGYKICFQVGDSQFFSQPVSRLIDGEELLACQLRDVLCRHV